MTTYYMGRVTSKNGRTLDTEHGTDRAAIAKVLFARNPKAKRVSTSICSPDGIDWHKDARWEVRS